MQKLGFPSVKSLDQFKSLSRSAKSFSFSSRPSTDSLTSGSFANLKLTAEKLVKEQASVKTDLEMANSKLKKSMEHVRILEEKLQNAVNENAKLKVKQKEDEKLWKGLESKFSSTKTLSDQLTETLQHLASQVQDAEKNKEFFEDKISSSMNAVDCQKQQMDHLSLKLGSAEEIITKREKELEDLKIEREERDKLYRDECCRTANLMDKKDAMIKKFEVTVADNRLETESLNSKVEEMHIDLQSKEDEIKLLMITKENLEKEKSDLQMSRDSFEKKLVTSIREIKNLEGFVHVFAAQLVDLDKQSLTFMEKFYQLNSHYESCFQSVQMERDLSSQQAQNQYDQLNDKFFSIASEKDALQLVNQELNSKIIKLQKTQESVKAQCLEECRLAGEKISRLESEAEALISKKIETELLVSKLEKEIDSLLENLRSFENKLQDQLLKISSLEMENKENMEKFHAEMQKKEEEINNLKQEHEKKEMLVDSIEKQFCQLQNILGEKEQLLLQHNDKEKKLEDQITENQAQLTAAESRLSEAKKQYDLMLESKQLELSRHLKEISQRNDQEINDIRRKYEVEKLEIVNMEKEKADKTIGEMERKCDQKLAECKEEAKQQLKRIQEEHAALVISIQQEYDKKEMNLKAEHIGELKCAELQAENELREEDRQRALLQLQWKVMGNKPQEDQEVNSKQAYSISSSKMRDLGVGKRSKRAFARAENAEKDPPFLNEAQTPVSQLLKKVENVNTGSMISIPKHHKKVTHHEYEVETSNGRTITKRRKTKSTVMFEDPGKRKKMNTTQAKTPRSVAKGAMGGANPHPSNIGDLFSEGSLNPYADDPYAFD
ncbi:Synaptonemal complex protein 1 [Citrus sinensis]|uniref:Synaptonemal complex protein 1 n=1 Tax=Citrus sinensis TaxID=2711 RepID=A0ACB8KQD1_CITSI|nr:Synaptonemal complex protein 1 [Citrus sinensis]